MHIDRVVEALRKEVSLVCTRCNDPLDKEKWFSEWDPNHPDNHHYKSIVCECGKKNWIRMDFHGSGHDRHLQERDKEIKSAISKVAHGLPQPFKK